MSAIADQSSMALWPSWVWGLIVLALLVAAALVCYSNAQRSHHRRQPREFEASPYGPRMYRSNLCMVATCDRTKAVDLGHGWVVCTEHANTLIGRGESA